MEILLCIKLLFISSAIFYLIVHIGLCLGVRRNKPKQNHHQPLVSVIVAARNEEKTMARLLHCLSLQTYSHCEFIIVNDRSTDNTADIIAGVQQKYPAFKRIDILEVPSDMPAKKNALRAGIAASKAEILCFTDADCFPPPHWIEELVKQFTPDVGLIAGYSPYQISTDKIISTGFTEKIFYSFIAYEEFRAAVWSAGSIGLRLGWLCTGRNLAYRRTVYEDVDGFESIKHSISGDDDLFLQSVRRTTKWNISYIATKESFVPTLPPESFYSFVEQRKRHFSASKFFSPPMKLFFFFYHFSNFLFFIAPILFLLQLMSTPILILCLTAKIAADILVVFSTAQIFNGNQYYVSFILMECLYFLYNSCIGPLGIFKKFEWKRN